MDAKEAIREAKGMVEELYSDEDIADVRLEELEFEEASDSWLVTLGLLRPTPVSEERHGLLRTRPPLKRTYKIVKIPNDHHARKSMKIREMTSKNLIAKHKKTRQFDSDDFDLLLDLIDDHPLVFCPTS